ncbi:MAG TPA: FtsX-like permease family protein [Acidimicrobiales bacterium]|nr:FtsX-like permease family protein [Acidimicrobiales bacterium]
MFDFVGQDYGPPYNGLLLDLEPGATVAPGTTEAGDVFGVIEPIEVQATTDATRFEPAILGALGLTGLLSILLTLVAVVRRRRTELATYRVLGFTPAQLRATIGVLGLVFGAGALVVGVPIGVAAGRVLWQRFAETLGVVDLAEVAWSLVGLAAVAVVAVCLVSAAPPAIAAGRRRHGRERPRVSVSSVAVRRRRR